MHIHTSCLANFSWACSPGTESAQKDCAAAEKVEENLFVTQLKKRMALTLEFLHHISNVQMLPRSHVVPLQRKWQSGLVMCRRSFTIVLNGTSSLPLPLLLSSLFLISLQDQVQLNLRLHARASRSYGPVRVLPLTACKREVYNIYIYIYLLGLLALYHLQSYRIHL